MSYTVKKSELQLFRLIQEESNTEIVIQPVEKDSAILSICSVGSYFHGDEVCGFPNSMQLSYQDLELLVHDLQVVLKMIKDI